MSLRLRLIPAAAVRRAGRAQRARPKRDLPAQSGHHYHCVAIGAETVFYSNNRRITIPRRDVFALQRCIGHQPGFEAPLISG